MNLIKLQQQINDYKKNIMPLDMLGRSLAYNSFAPRIRYKDDLKNLTHCMAMSFIDLEKNLHSMQIEKNSGIFEKKDNDTTPTMRDENNKNKHNFAQNTKKDMPQNINDDSFNKNDKTTLQNTMQKYNCIILSELESLKNYAVNKNENIFNNCDLIGTLRRLSPLYIIYDGIIIDTYQILECVIFGSDAVILDSTYLDKKKLNELLSFSYNLGIMPIFRARNTSDIKKLLFIKVPLMCIYIDENLMNLVPNNYYILCDKNANNIEGIDCFVSHFNVLESNSKAKF